ncbi:MAG TPA: nucleotidyltransferase family protein [Acidimicrobiales bacterium]|nr:nucleotidyltransferase family protein [Acidimicrobiales bacterium]
MTQIDPLLLAITRAGLPGTAPPPRDGWDDHLDAVLSQGLAGLFAATAAAGMVDIDAHMAGRLQRQLDAEAVRAVQLEGELLRLAPALDHLGAVVLKGAVLAHAAYPDPLLRPFTDIDLLVPGDQISHAIAVLATYGYQRARPEPAPGYDARVGKAVVLQHPGGVVVDLHRTLAAGSAGEGVDVTDIVATRRQVSIGRHTIPAPTWEAHLVECALHAVAGDGLTRPLSLRDIAEVAHHPSLDPGGAAELALRWQVADLVGLGLRAARDGLGLELANPLAALAHRADVSVAASEPVRSARSRLDEMRSGDLRRQATLARSLVAPSAEFLRWAHGDGPLPQLYGRRWRSLYERVRDARRDEPEPEFPPSADSGRADDGNGTDPVVQGRPTSSLPVLARDASPGSTLPIVSRRVAGALEPAAPTSRQEVWRRARPPRQTAATNGNGRSPHPSGAGNGRAGDNGDGQGGGDDDGSGPPAGSAATDGDPTRGTVVDPPARSGLAFGIVGAALLTIAAVGSQLGRDNLGVVLVPLAGLLLASAASLRIARVRPDEAWVGRWLVLAVIVKIGASYYRYHTAFNTYGGVADASGYDEYGRQFARAWLNGGAAPELENLRQLNFMRWFTGVVYYVFGTNMITGFFVFGLLAVIGSYFWYRATVDAVPRVDKRLYLALVMFAPSIAFWPSSIGKESLMQLGLGTVALATARLLHHRLARAAVLGFAGGWLLWVVRPHLLALATLAAGGAYAAGRVRGKGGAMRSLMARPVGLLAVVLLMAFTVSQATKFLGIEDLSLSSIEAELDENTERTSIGGSEYHHGGNSLNPLRLPEGAATVLLRPFPWETESSLQLVSSLESVLLVGLIVARLGSLRAALTRARTTPFLLYCWILVILYAATFSSIANFGLLVRQRALVLPALYTLISVRPDTATARSATSPPRQLAMSGGPRGG